MRGNASAGTVLVGPGCAATPPGPAAARPRRGPYMVAHRGQRSALRAAARAPQWARDLLRSFAGARSARLRAAITALRWVIRELETQLRNHESDEDAEASGAASSQP